MSCYVMFQDVLSKIDPTKHPNMYQAAVVQDHYRIPGFVKVDIALSEAVCDQRRKTETFHEILVG